MLLLFYIIIIIYSLNRVRQNKQIQLRALLTKCVAATHGVKHFPTGYSTYTMRVILYPTDIAVLYYICIL